MIQEVKSRIKRFLLWSSGQVKHLKCSAEVKKIWYGNEYGGFYLCPDYIHSQSICYSFGIGEDISFDQAIIENHNCLVYGFDPTPKAILWVKDQTKTVPSKFIFYEYGIGDKTGPKDFFLPQNIEHVSGSYVLQKNVNPRRKVKVELKSLTDIVKELGHKKIDVQKIDIEGAEYEVLGGILESSIFIDQILIEFHDRFFEDGRQKTIRAVEKLKEHGYEIFGVSPSFEEVSFISKKLL